MAHDQKFKFTITGKIILLSRGVRVQRMVIEDEGETELGSDHNLMWCVVRHEKAEKVTQEERYKWKVDRRQDWEDCARGVFVLGRETGRAGQKQGTKKMG